VVNRFWQCGQVLQQSQSVRQGVRCFLLRDDALARCVEVVSGCAVDDVADNAAIATVCANVSAVGEAWLAAFVAVLDVDSSEPLKLGTGSVGCT
jgi:hypothetical protein